MVDFRRHDPNVAGTATRPDRSVPGDTNRIEFGARRPVLRRSTLCPENAAESRRTANIGWLQHGCGAQNARQSQVIEDSRDVNASPGTSEQDSSPYRFPDCSAIATSICHGGFDCALLQPTGPHRKPAFRQPRRLVAPPREPARIALPHLSCFWPCRASAVSDPAAPQRFRILRITSTTLSVPTPISVNATGGFFRKDTAATLMSLGIRCGLARSVSESTVAAN